MELPQEGNDTIEWNSKMGIDDLTLTGDEAVRIKLLYTGGNLEYL